MLRIETKRRIVRGLRPCGVISNSQNAMNPAFANAILLALLPTGRGVDACDYAALRGESKRQMHT